MNNPPSIVLLEQVLDRLLPPAGVRGRPTHLLIGAARQWSEGVWAAAVASGPCRLDAREIDAGLALARRPVFVCGAHRSGTTLVRDLLDGHPALTVLPSEGTFFTRFEGRLAPLARDERLAHVGREWLRRLANPINRPPYWLLGRSATDSSSPYVTFARSLMAWWPLAESSLAVSSWPLVAVALAYASCTGRFIADAPTRWVEKTPTNESFADRLRQEFPRATIVHVLRDPFAVFASRKQLAADVANGGGTRKRTRPLGLNATRQVLRELAVSFRVARDQERSDEALAYHVLRYEDLVGDSALAVGKLALALEIDDLPILQRPTVNGMPASSNSATPGPLPLGRILPASVPVAVLTKTEQMMIAAAVGELAAERGYEIPRFGPVRTRMVRWGQKRLSPLSSRRMSKRDR